MRRFLPRCQDLLAPNSETHSVWTAVWGVVKWGWADASKPISTSELDAQWLHCGQRQIISDSRWVISFYNILVHTCSKESEACRGVYKEAPSHQLLAPHLPHLLWAPHLNSLAPHQKILCHQKRRNDLFCYFKTFEVSQFGRGEAKKIACSAFRCFLL